MVCSFRISFKIINNVLDLPGNDALPNELMRHSFCRLFLIVLLCNRHLGSITLKFRRERIKKLLEIIIKMMHFYSIVSSTQRYQLMVQMRRTSLFSYHLDFCLFVQAYGGLRGAVAFCLVAMLNPSYITHKNLFQTATLFIILFTVFIQVFLFI